MKRYVPILIAISMILLLILSWNNVFNYYREINAAFNSHMENAEKLESKRIYIDAVTEYESALKIHPDRYDLAVKIADLYEKLNHLFSWLSLKTLLLPHLSIL